MQMTAANLDYNLPRPDDVTWRLEFGKMEIMIIAVIFLQSLLVAWFLLLIA